MAGLTAAAVVCVASLTSLPPWSGASARPLLEGAQVDPGVRAIFARSCQDCHSERTHYPWYSYVAPVSLVIRNDVMDGRRHLNLSRWSEYSAIRRQRCLSEIANQVRDGDMPPLAYTFIHRGARLSPAEAEAVFRWTQEERLRIIGEKR